MTSELAESKAKKTPSAAPPGAEKVGSGEPRTFTRPGFGFHRPATEENPAHVRS